MQPNAGRHAPDGALGQAQRLQHAAAAAAVAARRAGAGAGAGAALAEHRGRAKGKDGGDGRRGQHAAAHIHEHEDGAQAAAQRVAREGDLLGAGGERRLQERARGRGQASGQAQLPRGQPGNQPRALAAALPPLGYTTRPHLGKGRGGKVVLHQRQEAVVQLRRRLVHAAVHLPGGGGAPGAVRGGLQCGRALGRRAAGGPAPPGRAPARRHAPCPPASAQTKARLSRAAAHAPAHLDPQGGVLKGHGVKGEVHAPVVQVVAALQPYV